MDVAIFMGMQATGKSSFYVSRFVTTHLRLNMDMLRTRHRESLLLRALIESKTSFVVDNTNPTRESRRNYIEACKVAQYRIVGYYFRSSLKDAMARNAKRKGKARISDSGLRATHAKLELPSLDEGFDALYYVAQSDVSGPGAGFDILEWDDEV